MIRADPTSRRPPFRAWNIETMKKALRVWSVVAVLSASGVLVHRFASPTPVAAAPTAESAWSFALDRVETVNAEESGERLFSFLFDVDRGGRPALSRAWSFPGTAPRSSVKEDVGRVYAWRLADADGATLSEGRHFDLLARYTIGTEGACEKFFEAAHAVNLRTPFDARATTLHVRLERETNDREEKR
jgi:hypothetical protein